MASGFDRRASVAVNSDIFRYLVQGVKEYAIFLLDPKGIVTTWNAGAENIKGYASEEIIGQHFSKFYLPEAVKNGWPMRELQIAEKVGRFADEGWRVKKDGSSFWASVSISAVRDNDGKLLGFAKVTRDLSDRRHAEERIQELNKQLRHRIEQLAETQRAVELRTMELQRLSGQLLQVQDAERRRIARELHDELGQELSALNMVLGGMEQDRLDKRVTDAVRIGERALETVRNLSYLLHPPLLDESGLTPALHWYVDGLSKRSGLEVSLTLKPVSFPRLPMDIEMTIFRIVQESLTNAYRHAETKSARVDLEVSGDTVIVQVRDYGKGLPSEMLESDLKVPRSMGVGLNGMRERVRQFGGELMLSQEEPGTKIEARIPLYGTAE
jgi:PAS domain S-box-containing protein